MAIQLSLTEGILHARTMLMGISRFKVISVIFPRKNFKMEKLMAMLSYPLSIFNRSNPEKEKEFYRGLVKSLKAKLENWEEYKPIRGMIEDIFKLAKNVFLFKEFASLYEAFSQKVRLSACTFGGDSGFVGH